MSDYKSIRLEKSFYTSPKGFSGMLEELDPSENYAGTYMEGTDAFQRQLKRFDIKTAGKNSDRVEKFFSTGASALFPEYVRRSVAAGMEKNTILPNIVATVTNIDSMDYRTFRSIPSDESLELTETEEGGDLQETDITVSSELVRLKKRGRLLSASYEALRFQRLDLFSVMLSQIGAYIAKTQLADAIKTLIGDDGEGNPTIATLSVSAAGSLTYADLVHFWNSFDPYSMDTVIASPDVLEKILNLGVFNDSHAGLNFHGTGDMLTPFGAKLFKTSALGSGKLIGLDSSCALEMVQAGGVLTEFDKLIDCQLERAAISTISGFSKIFDGAAKMLTV